MKASSYIEVATPFPVLCTNRNKGRTVTTRRVDYEETNSGEYIRSSSASHIGTESRTRLTRPYKLVSEYDTSGQCQFRDFVPMPCSQLLPPTDSLWKCKCLASMSYKKKDSTRLIRETVAMMLTTARSCEDNSSITSSDDICDLASSHCLFRSDPGWKTTGRRTANTICHPRLYGAAGAPITI
jgi:hypothetical protein